LKSFVDGIFELSSHLVVAKLVKKKDAKLVNLPREKQDLVPGTGNSPREKNQDLIVVYKN